MWGLARFVLRWLFVAPALFTLGFVMTGVTLVGPLGAGWSLALAFIAASALTFGTLRSPCREAKAERVLISTTTRVYPVLEFRSVSPWQPDPIPIATTASDVVIEPLSLHAPFSIHGPSLRKVRSDYSGNTYCIDVVLQTCTCPDFTDRRALLPLDTLARYCKHMLDLLAHDTPSESHAAWMQALMDEHAGGPTSACRLQLATAPDVVATLSFNSDWLNIYAPRRRTGQRIADASGRLKQHGWSLSMRRWSYGVAPGGAKEIRSMLPEVERILLLTASRQA